MFTHLGRGFMAAAMLLTAPVALCVASPAAADPDVPAVPGTAYTADALPTVQINGVVWDQLIVGDTVYVTGQFSSARPAGAAAGQSEIPRANILAYRLSTGELIGDFAPSLNGPGRALALSDDGSTLYVAGAFNQVNGKWHNNLAALDISQSGALIDSFRPVFNTTVNTIDVQGSTVYAGGAFTSVNGKLRQKLAAVDASTGDTLEWGASATGTNSQVYSLRLSPDGSKVVVGGSFQRLNGRSNPGYGLALLDAGTAEILSTPVNEWVRNGGRLAAIFDVEVDDSGFYGVGYSQSVREGNLEGAFRADWDGRLEWVEPCHGDSYSLYPAGSEVFTVSHVHSCETIGGFPDKIERINGRLEHVYYRGAAFSNTPEVPITRVGENDYHNWSSFTSPSLRTWYPDLAPGTFTGQYQSAFDMTGNADYLVLGGEFTSADGTPQQGLVRYPRRGATASHAPEGTGENLAVSVSAGEDGVVTATYTSTWDRDDAELTYSLFRDNDKEPVATMTASDPFWDLGQHTLQDTQAPKGTHIYRVVASDAGGNKLSSQIVPVTNDAGVVSPILAQDSYERTSKRGWGQSDLGGEWTVNSPSRFSVADSTGYMKLDRRGWTNQARLEDVSSSSTQVTTDFTLSEMPTGKGVYTSVLARRTTKGAYGVKIVNLPNGKVDASLVSFVGNTEKILSTQTVPGTWEPGTPVHVMVTATGEGTTTLSAQVSLGEGEATSLSVEDSTEALQKPGSVGLGVYVSAMATSTTQVFSISSFAAQTPENGDA